MIPISDNIISRGKPRVIYWVIGINLALFFWELKLENSGELSSVVNSWGVIPVLFNAAIANALSGNPAAGIVVIWRLTSLLLGMFLNGSFSQILGNLIFLSVFGKNVENILGHKIFLVFYLCSGIFTGLFQIITEPSSSVPFIGANGAIASVLGAYLFKFPKAKIDTILPLIRDFQKIKYTVGKNDNHYRGCCRQPLPAPFVVNLVMIEFLGGEKCL